MMQDSNIEFGVKWHAFLNQFYSSGKLINEEFSKSKEFTLIQAFVKQFTDRGFLKFQPETGAQSGRTDLLIYKNKEAILIDWKFSNDDVSVLKEKYEKKIKTYMQDEYIIEGYIYNIKTGQACQISRIQREDDEPFYKIEDVFQFDPQFLIGQPWKTGVSGKYKNYRGQSVPYTYSEIMKHDPCYLTYLQSQLEVARKKMHKYPYGVDFVYGCRQLVEYHEYFQKKERAAQVRDRALVVQLENENKKLKDQVTLLTNLVQQMLDEKKSAKQSKKAELQSEAQEFIQKSMEKEQKPNEETDHPE